ncbi:MAG: penicillin acylase family protein [Rhodoplanes sp.]
MLRRLLEFVPPSWRAALQPMPVSTRERLAQFPTDVLPLERPAVIRWNDFQVPFIEAETDRDLAFTFGMVHAHLRGAQIALFKRMFYGRLSEVVGPFARDLDHAIRIIDFGYAAEEIERRLPEETRVWAQAFVDGINLYHERAPRHPPEFALLGIRPEPYTRRDILVGARFAGTDSTWLTYFPLLARRGKPGFARLWNRTLEAGELPMPSGRPDDSEADIEDLLLNAGRLGSNSVAVSHRRSATGGALLANDPHMALSLPNSWILLGLRSPSYNAVGFSIAGLPMVGIGRNPDLGWGGTNMLAASSDLYDVSRLPADAFEARETHIASRWWFSTRRKIRRCAFGPIISDAKIFKCGSKRPIALRWVGHEPTDELTAFLRAARARTPEEFGDAFAGYGVCGENMLFADRNGNIGRVLAVTQPVRSKFPKDDMVLDAGDPQTHWRGFVGAKDLPFTLNPSAGALCSANDKPTGTNLPIGFSFGSQDRLRRLYELLGKRDRLGLADLVDLQTDTRALDAPRLSSALATELAVLPGDATLELADRIRAWDGDYSADSTGAVAFEAFLYHLVPALHGAKKAADLPDLFGDWSYLTTFLLSDLAAVAPCKRQVLLREAAAAAMLDVQRYAQWGDMHRLRVAHSLARLRLARRSFTIANLPVGGSRQTPMKSAHGLVNGRHAATFGSMARHISDLSDADANWFVVLGGQDGWLGSGNFADQLPLWRDRRYIRMPLRRETVSAEFPIVQRLQPMPNAGS